MNARPALLAGRLDRSSAAWRNSCINGESIWAIRGIVSHNDHSLMRAKAAASLARVKKWPK
jgi:hypothetical protein